MTKDEFSLIAFSVVASILLGLSIFFLSPERYPEPMVQRNEILQTINSLRHIYGRTLLDTSNQEIDLSINLHYLNRWRLKDIPLDVPARHTRELQVTPRTKVISYTSRYADHFPLNTFPYTAEEYPRIYDMIDTIPAYETLSLETLYSRPDLGITVIAQDNPYLNTEPLEARLIIVRDKDYQDYQAIIPVVLYPFLMLLISIPFGIISKQFPFGMIVRIALVLTAIIWYGITTVL